MTGTSRTVLLLALLLGWVGGPAGAGSAADRRWTWPVAGPPQVSRPFAPPAFRYGVGHRGVDVPAVPGATVRAAGAGRISYAGLLAGRGVVVVVHGALRTTYEPVTATVGLGSVVAAGEQIGRLEPGHGGCPAPACLHWGLRRGEDYLDPVRLVRPGPVRLLPLGSAPGTAGGGSAAVTLAMPAVPPRTSVGSAAAAREDRRARAAPAQAAGPRARPGLPPAGAAAAALGIGALVSAGALRRRAG